jgi:hypothetical protein
MARHSTKVNVQYFHWRCNATKSHNISAEELTTCLVQAPEPGQLAVTAAAAAAAATCRLHETLLPSCTSCYCTAGESADVAAAAAAAAGGGGGGGGSRPVPHLVACAICPPLASLAPSLCQQQPCKTAAVRWIIGALTHSQQMFIIADVHSLPLLGLFVVHPFAMYSYRQVGD